VDPSTQEPHTAPEPSLDSDALLREAKSLLVAQIAEQTGITDERLLGAFARVPRHRFVPAENRAFAYRDGALPIGYGQTISQPSMIAIMLQYLDVRPEDRVLEIGAGSGYAAALLGQLASRVYAIEIVPELAERAQNLIADLGYDNVTVLHGNGRFGLPEHAPFDKILVSAGAEDIPPELVRELAPGGRIAIPVGDDYAQQLMIGTKHADGTLELHRTIQCIFVPLVSSAPS